MNIEQAREKARKWIYDGGDGIEIERGDEKALSVTFDGLISALTSYEEYLELSNSKETNISIEQAREKARSLIDKLLEIDVTWNFSPEERMEAENLVIESLFNSKEQEEIVKSVKGKYSHLDIPNDGRDMDIENQYQSELQAKITTLEAENKFLKDNLDCGISYNEQYRLEIEQLKKERDEEVSKHTKTAMTVLEFVSQISQLKSDLSESQDLNTSQAKKISELQKDNEVLKESQTYPYHVYQSQKIEQLQKDKEELVKCLGECVEAFKYIAFREGETYNQIDEANRMKSIAEGILGRVK